MPSLPSRSSTRKVETVVTHGLSGARRRRDSSGIKRHRLTSWSIGSFPASVDLSLVARLSHRPGWRFESRTQQGKSGSPDWGRFPQWGKASALVSTLMLPCFLPRRPQALSPWLPSTAAPVPIAATRAHADSLSLAALV